MSIHFTQPKRLAELELPPLEDEMKNSESNPFNTRNSSTQPRATSSLMYLPIRSNELPPLESESENEDDDSNNKLNCAILNDSNIFTPNKNVQADDDDDKQKMKENNQNTINNNLHDDSLLNVFNKMNIKDNSEIKKCSPSHASSSNDHRQEESETLKSKTNSENNNNYRPIKVSSRQLIFAPSKPVLTEKIDVKPILSIFSNIHRTKSPAETEKTSDYSSNSSTLGETINQNIEEMKLVNKRIEFDVNTSSKKTRSLSITHAKENSKPGIQKTRSLETKSDFENYLYTASPKNTVPEMAEEWKHNVETPLKINENHFVTPQVKSFQVSNKRPTSRLFSGNTTNKSRTAIENEFRSQKILFTTPIAVSRPPVANSIRNDSISLSLDDTPVKKKLPAQERILSPIRENKNLPKKSSENLFPDNTIDSKKCDAEEKNENKNEKVISINDKDYLLLKRIGSGGSSSVFLARRLDNNMECALKYVNLEGDPAVIEGYLNETKLLVKLQGNENVVTLYDYSHLVKEKELFMIMEVGDSDLHKILSNYKSNLPLYTLVNFWYQILQSVDYIHANGVIHSDLKPANFLMINGRLKLIDFGIASNISYDSTSIIKCSQAGTCNYISPEALIDTSNENSPNEPRIKISKKSDVWSLGCILYLLIFRRTPFSHITNLYKKVSTISNPKTVIDYPKLPNFYPPLLQEMLQKCLQHNPKSRPTVAELLEYPFDMIIPLNTS